MATQDARSLAAVRVGTDLLGQINARVTEYRALRDAIAGSEKQNAAHVARAVEIENEIEALRAAILAIIRANVPAHQTDGARFRLMNPSGEWGDWIDLSALAPRGWTPVFAAEPYGSGIVQRIVDYTGGGGTKPPAGKYLGAGGLVDDISAATDVRGATGFTPNISVLSTTTLAPGAPATVAVDPSSTPEEPRLVFGVPEGEKGDIGPAATVTVAGTDTLPPGAPAGVVNEGTAGAARLRFSIPAGVQGNPGSPGEPLIATVSDALDTGPGGWWLARDYHGAATFSRFRAEMLAGTAEGVSLYIEKNGAPFAGPFALDSDAPTIIAGLSLVLAPGDAVAVYRAGGTLTGPWLMFLQMDGRS